MREIVDILMRRDNISENEAIAIVRECRDEIMDAAFRGSYTECEDILAFYLNLEPDYLDFFLM